MNERQRKMIFRAHRRGFREMDLVMGAFADAHIEAMSEPELDEFERLLSIPDWEVYNWLTGRADIPPNHRGPVLDQLCAFDYAARSA